ncbi:hypothetical protein STHAL_05865 [Streptomyces halstedii]|uniref:Lipoprotein n=1 Tax=Streptomyces halstedii TaxID=1944 RepID=A0ABS6TL86_STRHA|nr:hypothetical protein [Streptomyces halstedii]
MTNRRTRQGGLLGAALAGFLIVGATSCSGGDGRTEKEPDAAVAAGSLCGGSAVSAGAVQALETITGASRFYAAGETSTVARAAKELVEGATSSAVVDGEVCRVYTARSEFRITWRLSDSASVDDPASKFSLLDMGERALAAPDGAFLRFACLSERVPGSGPVRIDIGVERGGMPTEPEGDPEALKDAYATVAHSFSLAMAKELGCENDGQLKSNPSLDRL